MCTWDSIVSSSAGSGAVVFSGGVDCVLACGVILVHMGFTVSGTRGKLVSH